MFLLLLIKIKYFKILVYLRKKEKKFSKLKILIILIITNNAIK